MEMHKWIVSTHSRVLVCFNWAVLSHQNVLLAMNCVCPNGRSKTTATEMPECHCFTVAVSSIEAHYNNHISLTGQPLCSRTMQTRAIYFRCRSLKYHLKWSNRLESNPPFHLVFQVSYLSPPSVSPLLSYSISPCSLSCLICLNPLNPKLNPICYLLALLAHHFLHVSRIRVKSLTLGY